MEEFTPWVIEGPVEMSFEFYPQTSPNGEAKQRPPRIYRGSTVLEAFEQWLGK
jgi:hypothetical protein